MIPIRLSELIFNDEDAILSFSNNVCPACTNVRFRLGVLETSYSECIEIISKILRERSLRLVPVWFLVDVLQWY